jgi:hypothetical protein
VVFISYWIRGLFFEKNADKIGLYRFINVKQYLLLLFLLKRGIAICIYFNGSINQMKRANANSL